MVIFLNLEASMPETPSEKAIRIRRYSDLFRHSNYYPATTNEEQILVERKLKEGGNKCFVITDGRDSNIGPDTWKKSECFACLYVKEKQTIGEDKIKRYDIFYNDKGQLFIYYKKLIYGPYNNLDRLLQKWAEKSLAGFKEGRIDLKNGIRTQQKNRDKSQEDIEQLFNELEYKRAIAKGEHKLAAEIKAKMEQVPRAESPKSSSLSSSLSASYSASPPPSPSQARHFQASSIQQDFDRPPPFEKEGSGAAAMPMNEQPGSRSESPPPYVEDPSVVARLKAGVAADQIPVSSEHEPPLPPPPFDAPDVKTAVDAQMSGQGQSVPPPMEDAFGSKTADKFLGFAQGSQAKPYNLDQHYKSLLPSIFQNPYYHPGITVDERAALRAVLDEDRMPVGSFIFTERRERRYEAVPEWTKPEALGVLVVKKGEGFEDYELSCNERGVYASALDVRYGPYNNINLLIEGMAKAGVLKVDSGIPGPLAFKHLTVDQYLDEVNKRENQKRPKPS